MKVAGSLLPGPHEGVVVRVEGGEVFEDVIVAAHRLLTLHRTGAVVPGVIDQDLAVMEADAEDEVVEALYPAHHSLHLLGTTSHKLIVCSAQVPPAWELSVEVQVVDVCPPAGLVTVRVDGGHEVNLRGVEQPGDLEVSGPPLTQVTTQTWRINFLYSSLQTM